MTAFETAQGIITADSDTAKPERNPTPPPKVANRMKGV